MNYTSKVEVEVKAKAKLMTRPLPPAGPARGTRVNKEDCQGKRGIAVWFILRFISGFGNSEGLGASRLAICDVIPTHHNDSPRT